MKNYMKRMNKRTMIFAYSILGIMTLFAILAGGFGIAGAVGVAMALPALTDEESAFLEHVKSEIGKAQEKFEKNYISETKMNEQIEAVINKHLENVSTKQQLEELNKTLEEQGLVINRLKAEKSEKRTIKDVIKSAFSQEGLQEKLVDARNNNKVVDVFKVVGTVTTGQVSTDTGGNALLDMLNADEINSLRLRNQFIEDFCTVTRTGKPVFTYVDYVPKEGAVDFVAEGGTKSQIDLQAVVRTISPNKAAAWTELTEESVTDVPRMESEARINLLKRYILKRQNGILFGDGISPNPTGITSVAPAFNGATWTGDTKAAPNLYDVMVAVKNQIELAANYTDDVDYYPNVCFINPADYNNLLINQDEKVYTFSNVNGQKLMNIDGIAIVPKKEIPAGKILMGDFTRLEVINYIDYNVRIGWINDDFIKNQFVMLGEGRFYVLVRELDKLAFVYDDIANVETVLTTI